jgi:hypothetical protein
MTNLGAEAQSRLYLTTLITILNDVEAAEGLSSEKFFSRDNK